MGEGEKRESSMRDFDRKFNFIFGLTGLVIVVQILAVIAAIAGVIYLVFTTSPTDVGAFFGEIIKGFKEATGD